MLLLTAVIKWRPRQSLYIIYFRMPRTYRGPRFVSLKCSQQVQPLRKIPAQWCLFHCNRYSSNSFGECIKQPRPLLHLNKIAFCLDAGVRGQTDPLDGWSLGPSILGQKDPDPGFCLPPRPSVRPDGWTHPPGRTVGPPFGSEDALHIKRQQERNRFIVLIWFTKSCICMSMVMGRHEKQDLRGVCYVSLVEMFVLKYLFIYTQELTIILTTCHQHVWAVH